MEVTMNTLFTKIALMTLIAGSSMNVQAAVMSPVAAACALGGSAPKPRLCVGQARLPQAIRRKAQAAQGSARVLLMVGAIAALNSVVRQQEQLRAEGIVADRIVTDYTLSPEALKETKSTIVRRDFDADEKLGWYRGIVEDSESTADPRQWGLWYDRLQIETYITVMEQKVQEAKLAKTKEALELAKSTFYQIRDLVLDGIRQANRDSEDEAYFNRFVRAGSYGSYRLFDIVENPGEPMHPAYIVCSAELGEAKRLSDTIEKLSSEGLL